MSTLARSVLPLLAGFSCAKLSASIGSQEEKTKKSFGKKVMNRGTVFENWDETCAEGLW
jgi:hypothetical protein